ncbi:MAG TPA: ABC transporter ATP-binding protein, partial [Phycisphaerae bacterium]|nr:ABC transporter ATP-binding protein [Phycisphaerae bacterium]
VRVENLTRHFGRTRAVDGISFTFPSGRIFGFVGPNGAGKTTTMRILATADEPTAGDAFVDGVSVVEDPEKARHLVGFMPDYLPSHRDMTVPEYLDFFARAYGLRNPRRREALAGLEEFAGLATLRDKTIQSLSKGMKQRVSLARALVHDPPVLILDEPAAGLDPRARVELRELLKILAQQGKAILVSSHILSELSEIVDGAIIIERGKIVRAGMMDEILSRDLPGRLVVIRVNQPPEELHKALLQMPGVQTARIAGRHVEAAVEGDEEACRALLAELLRRGFPVVEFTQRRADLEELFMNLTKGEVQ